ncbi:MAG: CYTH domain-containing protein, partial [Alphaproteobacteria bacterium]|nr:CYTH domain-containing protein [Alphaproteobacteria bacterium]
MQSEIELKFYPIDKDATRAKLRAAGFSLVHPEYMPKRAIFAVENNLDVAFARVRQEADCITMSIKKTSTSGIQGNTEICLKVDNYENAIGFLNSLKFRQKAYQETLRETWRRGDVEADIDTWPGLKPFIEIEGKTEEQVKTAATDLGFDIANAMFGDAGHVYEFEG